MLDAELVLLALRTLPLLPLAFALLRLALDGTTGGNSCLRAMSCRRPNSCFFTTSNAFSRRSNSSEVQRQQ